MDQPVRRPAERTRGLGTTIFAEMSALATATGSVNLGQGFPDTDGPVEVVDAAVAAMRSGVNQYPPGPGTLELRESVAFHRERFTGLTYDPETEVLVTTGATEAIAAALLGLVDPGDEVVVLEPYYDSYVANIAFAGGVRRPVTLRPPHYALDVDELRAAVTPRTRLMLLNTPHNPTGAVLSRAELSAVAEIAVDHDLVVVVDEVYEHMTYERPHVALATLPGDALAHLVDRVSGQDLLHDGLEDRLGHRTGGPRRGSAHRQAVPDVHLGCAVPAGGRPRPAPARQLLQRPGRQPARQSGTDSATGSPTSASRSICRPGPTSPRQTCARWATTTA